jgi:hypothetical protein
MRTGELGHRLRMNFLSPIRDIIGLLERWVRGRRRGGETVAFFFGQRAGTEAISGSDTKALRKTKKILPAD